MRLARRICELRGASGLSQLELGKRVGLAYTYISRLEHGRVAPSLALLERLAKGLDVEVYQIFLDTRADPLAPGICLRGAQEQFLLRAFRELSDEDRSAILFMARKLAGSKPIVPAYPFER